MSQFRLAIVKMLVSHICIDQLYCSTYVYTVGIAVTDKFRKQFILGRFETGCLSFQAIIELTEFEACM